MTTATTVEVEPESEYTRVKTSVWWDIENCEVPKGLNAYTVARNVFSALSEMNYRGTVSISAYGDIDLIPQDVQQGLSSTGVRLNHVPAGVKDASDKKILVDMCLWAADNPAPANFMLISGDRDFSYALHKLSMRRYNILLAQPPHASAPLVSAAKYVWLWKSLASGGPPLTNGESSGLINNGHSLVSKYQVSKNPVPEQAQFRKPPESTSDAGETKDHKTKPGGLPQDTRSNMPQDGRRATCESVNDHISDKRNISEAAVLGSQKAQTSVSAKPIKESEVVETVVCQVCHINCANKETYAKHTYGKRHKNNLELQSRKSENMSGGAVESPKDVLEKLKMKKNSTDFKAKQNAKYVCRLCNVICQKIDFDSHLRGKKHASMLNQSGDQALVDSKKLQEKGVGEKDQPIETIADPKQNADYVCHLCNVTCHSQSIFDFHSSGQKHAAILSQSQAIIDSKKLQENEKYSEPQLQSQNAQENSKCFEKHVVIVNPSEALINSRKLEGKGVQEKAQTIETIPETKSQSQNTQERNKFFEKQNEELKEKCGSIESIVKDRVESVNQHHPNGEFLFGDLRCVSELPKEERDCFDGIVKPLNLSKGVLEHSGDVKKKKKEVVIGQARADASELCNLCIVICDSQGLSTVVCDNKAHWTNQNHTNASFVASDDAQSSVSTKPIKEPEGLLQPVWCQVCQISCNNKVAYANHTYGKKHRQNLEVQSAKNGFMSKESAKLSKENAEKKKKVLCRNQTAFDSHLKGHNNTALVKEQAEVKVLENIDDLGFQGVQANEEKETNTISESSELTFTELKRESIVYKEQRHPLNMIPERVKLPADWNLTKKTQNQTVFGSCVNIQDNAAIVKEPAEVLIDQRKIRKEKEKDQEKETTEEKQSLTKIEDLRIRERQDSNKKLKDGCSTLKTLVFTEPNREYIIPKESRGCLDVIPDRVVVSVEDKLKLKPEPKSLEHEAESAGRKEHSCGEVARKEEIKGQVDNFWTRLWGKKS